MSAGAFLKTMGYPELRARDGRLLKLKVKKHLGLLIYLAVEEGRSHPREELVELFWPGVPLHNGRHSLSMALTVLRAAVGRDAIRGTGTQVRFSAAGLELDLERLFRSDITGNHVTPALEVEQFLLGFDINDAPQFQHWRDRQQAQLLPSLQSGLFIAIDQARRTGSMVRVLELAERLLRMDSLAEEGIRAKMEALALQGDRVSALRVFEEWKCVLDAELGAAPSEPLESMASRLRRRGIERPVAPSQPSVQTEHWADRQFVGRAEEYRRLTEAWEATTQCNTQHVLITGDTGVGKSTLAMRFGTAAALEGAAVARVQCFEMEQQIPFGMIGALVANLLDRPGAVATAPASLAEIARVVPRVRERFGNLPAPRRTEGEAARLHFAEGTFALFEAIMEEQPLVLLVDDYPRSDEASLNVIHMLLRRAAGHPLMLVLTGRPPEPGESAQAARVRKGVAYLPLRHIELGPLSAGESDELMTAALARTGKVAALPDRKAILQAAGGNPMALELLTQDWVQHGDAAMALSIPAMKLEVPQAAMEAVSYDRVVQRLLPALSPKTRAALHLAVILGPRLNDLDAFDLVDLSPAQAMAAMTELMDARVLRDVGGRLEFTNELLRGRLYLRIPGTVRTRLHDAVAVRLIAASTGGEAIPGLEIAWHCIRAKRNPESLPYLMGGARQAILHGAPEEAARALSSALTHLRGAAKEEAGLLLAETYQEMSRWEESLECLPLRRDKRARYSAPLSLAEVMEIECRRRLGHFDVETLREIAQVLFVELRDPTQRPLHSREAIMLARVGTDLKDLGLCRALRDFITDSTFEDQHYLDRGRFLLARAYVAYQCRDNDLVLEDVHQALEILESQGVTDTTYSSLLAGAGVVACARGQYAAAIPPLEKAYHSALRLDNSPAISQATQNLSLCNWRLGNVPELVRWANIARLSSAQSPAGTYDRVMSAMYFAFAAMKSPSIRFAEAVEWLEQETAAAWAPWISQAGQLFKADVYALAGRKRQAYAAARRARAISEAPLSIGMTGSLTRWSTLLLLESGEGGRAWKEIQPALSSFELLDLKDQTDILFAALLAARSLSLETGVLELEYASRIRLLPAQYVEEINCLRVMAN